MAANGHSTVAVVFETAGQAESAIDELRHAGFRQNQIGILTPSGRVEEAETPIERTEEEAATGAARGAVAGGAVGAAAGALAGALIPGIGPILAGGIFTGILLGGAAGAAAGSYAGPFVALGFSEEDARHYGNELKEGRTIVSVRAEDRATEALSILRSHGGHNGNTALHAEAARRF
jgi:uncharacterized membrane protein